MKYSSHIVRPQHGSQKVAVCVNCRLSLRYSYHNPRASLIIPSHFSLCSRYVSFYAPLSCASNLRAPIPTSRCKDFSLPIYCFFRFFYYDLNLSPFSKLFFTLKAILIPRPVPCDSNEPSIEYIAQIGVERYNGTEVEARVLQTPFLMSLHPHPFRTSSACLATRQPPPNLSSSSGEEHS